MKRIILFAISGVVLLSASVLLTGFVLTPAGERHVENAANDPVAVATLFIQHLNRLEFNEAKRITTVDSHYLLDLFEFEAMLPGLDEPGEETPFTILRSEVEGDRAAVYYMEQGDIEEDVVNLRFENGQWLVHMGKDDIMDDDYDFFFDSDFDFDRDFDRMNGTDYSHVHPDLIDFIEEDGNIDYEMAYAAAAGRVADAFLAHWNAGDFASASEYSNTTMTRFLFERVAGQHGEIPADLEISEGMMDGWGAAFRFTCYSPSTGTAWTLHLAGGKSSLWEAHSLGPFVEE